MQAFLVETAHNKSMVDPDFDFQGVSYVFKLLFMGTMPWANRVNLPSPVPPPFLRPAAAAAAAAAAATTVAIKLPARRKRITEAGIPCKRMTETRRTHVPRF